MYKHLAKPKVSLPQLCRVLEMNWLVLVKLIILNSNNLMG